MKFNLFVDGELVASVKSERVPQVGETLQYLKGNSVGNAVIREIVNKVISTYPGENELQLEVHSES